VRERWLVGGLALLLVASRVRLVQRFGAAWTDEDQSLLWFATTDLLDGHLREPYFFGQTYGSWLEALVAAPLVALGVGLRWALPMAGSFLGTAPWLLLAGVAWWRRRAPLASVAILSAGVALALEGAVVSTMPRGLLPGVVLGVVAAAVVLWKPHDTGPLGGFAFGLLLVVAASWNMGSGLVTGPVAVHLVLTALLARRWRTLGALAAGLALGGAAHVSAQAFYRARPLYDVHPTPSLDFASSHLRGNLGELPRYLTAFAPELWRWWVWPLVALAGVVAWTAWRGRSWPTIAAAVTLPLVAVAMLATSKAGDGTPSIFFPWSRVLLGLPWAVAVLALLPDRPPSEDRRGAATAAVAAAVAVAVAALGVASFAVREVRLTDRTAGLLEAAHDVPPVVPVDTVDLLRRCERRRVLVRTLDAEVVLERYDRTAAYGCGALLRGDGIETLFPTYERRTWLLERASTQRVGVVLASGLDGCPDTTAAIRCRVVDEGERLHVVEGPPQTISAWSDLLGMPARPLPVRSG
jgi:hypothetical protein